LIDDCVETGMGKLIEAVRAACTKPPILFLFVASACAMASSPAVAFHFIPVNTNFEASGTVGFAQGMVGYTCTLDAIGKTGATGKIKITKVTLTGNSDCSATKAIHLPWKIKASGPSGANIKILGFNGPVGECGPSPGAIQVDGTGHWIFDLLLHPTCIVSGELTTSPAITIAK
jgi:hypothetical protein